MQRNSPRVPTSSILSKMNHSGRNSQSIFWNVSIFDTAYLDGLYGDFVYPDDFSKVNIPSVMNLQKYF